MQPMTLMFRMVEFQRAAFEAYVREHPDQWRGVHGLWDLIREATRRGELDLPREDILFFGTPHEREVSVNSTRVTGVLGDRRLRLEPGRAREPPPAAPDRGVPAPLRAGLRERLHRPERRPYRRARDAADRAATTG